jgi:hypothetical protein
MGDTGVVTRFIRILGAVVFGTAGLSTLSGTVPSAHATVARQCAAVPPALVQKLLGADATHVTGPMVVRGACSWHGDSPSCGMRSLSMRVVQGRSAPGLFNAERTSLVARDEVSGVGDAAFASTDPNLFGAAIGSDRLDVLTGQRWIRLSLLGRFSPDITREQMADLARSPSLA